MAARPTEHDIVDKTAQNWCQIFHYLGDVSKLSKVVLDLLVRELWLQFTHVDFTFLGFGFFDGNFFTLY